MAGDEAEAPASPATPAGAPQPPRMPPATVQWLLDHYETAEGGSSEEHTYLLALLQLLDSAIKISFIRNNSLVMLLENKVAFILDTMKTKNILGSL